MLDLAAKLQLRQGQSLLCFGCPALLLPRLPDPPPASDGGPVDAVLGFCATPEQVGRQVPALLSRLRSGGLLWMAFRKGQKPPALTRDHGWQALEAKGYETVRAIALDAEWSALRFRHSSEKVTAL